MKWHYSFSMRCYSTIPLKILTNEIKSSKSILVRQQQKWNASDICQLSATRKTDRGFPKEISIFPQYYSKMSTPVPEKSACIFCNIINKLEDTEILFEDEQVCIFRDIKPSSRFHTLTVPKRHIEDCKSLTSEDKELVDHMLAVSKDLLQKNNFSLDDARLGYHWPPFRSVKHLHLHTIAPESEMGFIGKMVFRKDSYWFVSPEYVKSRL